MTGKLCLALDTREQKELERVAAATMDYVAVFKVGLTTIYSCGTETITRLATKRPVFADLKLHDIPAQVEGATASMAALGASYVTVHAAGGPEMIKAACSASGDKLKVLAVTVLTSLGDDDLARMGINWSSERAVMRLAEIAVEAGADGLVCSPLEVASLRARFGEVASGGPLLAVPGIRPSGTDAGGQRRAATPASAAAAGADLLVIGRPITKAADPAAAARSILKSIRT